MKQSLKDVPTVTCAAEVCMYVDSGCLCEPNHSNSWRTYIYMYIGVWYWFKIHYYKQGPCRRWLIHMFKVYVCVTNSVIFIHHIYIICSLPVTPDDALVSVSPRKLSKGRSALLSVWQCMYTYIVFLTFLYAYPARPTSKICFIYREEKCICK